MVTFTKIEKMGPDFKLMGVKRDENLIGQIEVKSTGKIKFRIYTSDSDISLDMRELNQIIKKMGEVE